MKLTTGKSSVVTQILLSAVAIGLGYLLLFNNTVQIATLCQLFCGGLVIVGIVSIIAYFVSNDYKRIDRYGFTLGVMMILLGCIGLLRMESLTANFEIYTGMLALVLGVLTLQGTVQVKVMDYAVWILNLILAIVSIGGAFCVLSNITFVTQLVAGFSNWMLLVCGGASLFSLLVTWICIMLVSRKEKKAQKEAQNQSASEEKEEIPHGDYKPVDAPKPPVSPSAPVEVPHEEPAPAAPAPAPVPAAPAAEAPSAEVEPELPPVEKPDLVFDTTETPQ